MLEQKGGLGKGLSALFEQKKNEENSATENKIRDEEKIFVEVEIDKINLNPYQPREDFDEERLNELAESIKLKGLIQPVTVKPSDGNGKYDLISGERRIRAVRKLGHLKIPAYIYKTEDNSKENLLMLALIENIQRDDLNPMELSDSYQKLLDEFELTQEMVADKVAKKRSTIANFLRLQKLPVEIKISLRKNEINEAHARTLLRVDNYQDQITLWRRIISENLSVRQLEEMTRASIKPRKKKEAKIDNGSNSHLTSLEEKLRFFFGTKVKIKSKTKYTGEIVIDYYSEEDLERILDKCS